MKLSNKALLICCISTQIITLYGNPNPKTYLVNTKENEGKDKSNSSKKGADYDGATEECSTKDIKRPLAFVMDTTNSVSRYEGSVKELTTTLLDEIVDSGVNIPDWILTKFWDFDCETEGSIEENTELVIQTPDSGAMKEALNDIKIGNPPDADNCDKPERAFQGLLLTLQTIPKYGMIMLLTDTASKNLELFDELVKLRDSKEVLIYVVFTPHYQEEKYSRPPIFVGDPSWLKYKEISNGKLYDMAEYDRAKFLKEIVFSIKEECVPVTTPSPPPLPLPSKTVEESESECTPEAVQRPMAFCIDATGSVSESGIGIKQLTYSLIDEAEERGFSIPKWILTTFTDINEDIESNTKLVIETPDSGKMKAALKNTRFAGGGDIPERAFQGLQLTLQTIPQHGMIMLITDAPTKNFELFDELMKLRDEKKAEIYVVFTPTYVDGEDESWHKFKELSNGKMYDMANYKKEDFLNAILHNITDNCKPTEPPVELSETKTETTVVGGGGGVEIVSCTASVDGESPCDNAIDGNTKGKGW